MERNYFSFSLQIQFCLFLLFLFFSMKEQHLAASSAFRIFFFIASRSVSEKEIFFLEIRIYFNRNKIRNWPA